MNIELHVNAAFIRRLDNNIIPSGQASNVLLKCTFEEPGWANTTNYATFVIPGVRAVFKEKIVDGVCKVPPEALAKPGPLVVGVYGLYPTTDVCAYNPTVTTVTLRQGAPVDGEHSNAVTISEWFAEQAAIAKKAAETAVKAANIANELVKSLKKGVNADE